MCPFRQAVDAFVRDGHAPNHVLVFPTELQDGIAGMTYKHIVRFLDVVRHDLDVVILMGGYKVRRMHMGHKQENMGIDASPVGEGFAEHVLARSRDGAVGGP